MLFFTQEIRKIKYLILASVWENEHLLVSIYTGEDFSFSWQYTGILKMWELHTFLSSFSPSKTLSCGDTHTHIMCTPMCTHQHLHKRCTEALFKKIKILKKTQRSIKGKWINALECIITAQPFKRQHGRYIIYV